MNGSGVSAPDHSHGVCSSSSRIENPPDESAAAFSFAAPHTHDKLLGRAAVFERALCSDLLCSSSPRNGPLRGGCTPSPNTSSSTSTSNSFKTPLSAEHLSTIPLHLSTIPQHLSTIPLAIARPPTTVFTPSVQVVTTAHAETECTSNAQLSELQPASPSATLASPGDICMTSLRSDVTASSCEDDHACAYGSSPPTYSKPRSVILVVPPVPVGGSSEASIDERVPVMSSRCEHACGRSPVTLTLDSAAGMLATPASTPPPRSICFSTPSGDRVAGNELTSSSTPPRASSVCLATPSFDGGDELIRTSTSATIARTPRILVVEDSTPTRKLMLLLLQRMQFRAEGAENGQVAVDLVERMHMMTKQPPPNSSGFDLILMDGFMPGAYTSSLCPC